MFGLELAYCIIEEEYKSIDNLDDELRKTTNDEAR